ncbi:molybdenum cofactor biosynthesis protein MoaE [Methyloligella solikamskensis]|uniref:Molybdopterin synthase catalytic subunit n=1 Tax=Methyloligella solikamskensis TaxID=1177756 RepID=A0ABW3J976_9HYPH
MIRIQEADFDLAEEVEILKDGRTDIGAIVTFTGVVRDRGSDKVIDSMNLEHYPGMTEKELARIEAQAHERWPLQASLIVHRVGKLVPGENIVLVATASEHRHAAFEAASFLMDYLKTDAPFWKFEDGPDGAGWVEARDSDDAAKESWSKQPSNKEEAADV